MKSCNPPLIQKTTTLCPLSQASTNNSKASASIFPLTEGRKGKPAILDVPSPPLLTPKKSSCSRLSKLSEYSAFAKDTNIRNCVQDKLHSYEYFLRPVIILTILNPCVRHEIYVVNTLPCQQRQPRCAASNRYATASNLDPKTSYPGNSFAL